MTQILMIFGGDLVVFDTYEWFAVVFCDGVVVFGG